MRFSLNFIKEFVDLGLQPAELAEKLTMAGMEVEGFRPVGNDWIFDIEVTTNRYDWLSMAGIAREIAAVLYVPFKFKASYDLTKKALVKRKVVVQDEGDCPYYLGQLLTGTVIGVSQEAMNLKIKNCGINTVNDAVDITNYCMLKWGNPLHAFDDDKIEGDIYIRRAKKGETFVGIDEKEYSLTGDNLVVADAKKIIALAGVMGAKNTEVDNSTKNIFLEAAVFSPLVVRRSRRAAGIDTESSYRFERMVSPLYLEYAAAEAAGLIEKKTTAALEGLCKAGRRRKIDSAGTVIYVNRLNEYLGLSAAQAQIIKVFKTLGCKVNAISKGKIKVFPAEHRFDLNSDVDFYEEFARIHGYDKVPSLMPFLVNNSKESIVCRGVDNFYSLKNQIRRLLSMLGYSEIVAFSIEAEEELSACGQRDQIILVNPLRAQENAMRTTLLTGMLKSLRHNLNRGQEDLRLFEVADTYHKTKQGFSETAAVSIGCAGNMEDFFKLKGVVENFLSTLPIEIVSYNQVQKSGFSNALEIKSQSVLLGFIGKIDAAIKKYYDLRRDVFYAQLEIPALIKAQAKNKYKPFSAYPPVWRDISMRLERGVVFESIAKTIEEKGQFISDMRLVDIYKQAQTLDEESMFTLRIFYQSSLKTLTAAEVDTIHTALRQSLDAISGVTLR